MITYIKKSNASDYRNLFDKATNVLIQGGLDKEAAQINSLEEYFAQIKTIVEYSNDRRYTILPLDEDVFEIDANKRLITVPNSFKTNGISVQGDQVAEVVYFKINRFFDATDLNEMDIFIQWETPGIGSSKGDQGISREWVRDLESDPGKLIFGWPLSDEITARSGNVKFAVRFVKFDPANPGEVLYSFSTLTAEAPIKSALDFDLKQSEFTPIDHSQLLMDRLVNSSAPILGAGVSGRPEIIGNGLAPIVDLIPVGDGSQGEIALHVQAQSPDAGAIGYKWHYYPLVFNANTNEYVLSDSPEGYGAGSIVYYQTKDLEENPDKDYFIMIQDEYGLVELNGKKYRPEQAADAHWQMYIDSEYAENATTTIYEKFCKFVAKDIGRYTVTVTNKRGKANESQIPRGAYVDENGEQKVESFADLHLITEILAPEQPEIYGVYVKENETIKLASSYIIAEPGQEKPELQDGEIVHDKAILYGYAEASDTAAGKAVMEYRWINGSTEVPDTTENTLEVEGQEGVFKLKVYNTRNFHTRTDLSNSCRVSYPPINPSLKDPAIDYMLGQPIKALDLIETGTGRADATDPFKYQWYVATTGGKKTPIDGATSSTYTPVELLDHYVEVYSVYNGVSRKEGTMSKALNIVKNPLEQLD